MTNDHRDALDALNIEEPKCCHGQCEGNWGTGCYHCHTRECGCYPSAYWRHRCNAALRREREAARKVADRVERDPGKLDQAARILLLAVAMPVELIAEDTGLSHDYIRGVVSGYWAVVDRLKPELDTKPEPPVRKQ
jgi:hypothetical protein